MTLLELLAPLLNGGRLAVLGIGNELNGDDAAGVLVARKLKAALAPADDLYIVEAGPSAESFTGPLRRFAPTLVVLVDAAELGLPPGSVRCYDWPDAEGLSASTHTLPPSMLAKFLVRELDCGVALVGIQPKSLDLDAPVSAEVLAAVERVAAEMVHSRLG
jgi:hydrogenase 3 maturation protease